MSGQRGCKVAWMAMAMVVSSVACVDPYPIDATGDSVGVVTLALTQVPSDARCIRLTSDAAGRRTVATATLTPGAASFTTTFGGLPVGSQVLWADVFNTACTSVTATTVATWVSDPVTVVTTATGTPSVWLNIRRPGGVAVSVDFCSAGTHTCSGTCFSDTDATHCGPSCVNCTQPNATASCSGGKCANTCTLPTATLSCPAVGGKPNCSQWNFDSLTTEGWVFNVLPSGTGAAGGALVASTAQRISGAASLAIPYNNQGNTSRYVEISVRLCSGGQLVNLANKQIRYSFKMNPPQAGGFNYITTGGAVGGFDFNGDADGVWDTYTNTLNSGWDQVTSIGFHLQTTQSYNGTLYLDDIRVF